MAGFDRTPVPSKPGRRKVHKPSNQPAPSPSPKPTPSPEPDRFSVPCFGPGGRFLIPTQATGPGPVGGLLGMIPMRPNAGDVPDVPGLTEPVTQPLEGVTADNYQAVLSNLKAARNFMADTALYYNQLQNQDEVIACFEDFGKSKGWQV